MTVNIFFFQKGKLQCSERPAGKAAYFSRRPAVTEAPKDAPPSSFLSPYRTSTQQTLALTARPALLLTGNNRARKQQSTYGTRPKTSSELDQRSLTQQYCGYTRVTHGPLLRSHEGQEQRPSCSLFLTQPASLINVTPFAFSKETTQVSIIYS